MSKSIKQYVFKKGARLRIPVSGTFELTPRCNLDCKMCYVHMTEKEQQSLGRELETEEWIKIGKEAVDAGMIYLLLTGGEPLLRPDFKKIYTSLHKMGLLITVNTNGTLVTPEIIEMFYDYRPEKVNVTLYGMSERTYHNLCENASGFEAALSGIRRLKQAGINVNINTTFTNLNKHDMESIIQFALEERIPIRTAAFTFPPISNHHTNAHINLKPEEMGHLLARFDKMTMDKETLEKRRHLVQNQRDVKVQHEEAESKQSSCMAAKGSFWISWDGNVYPCGMLPEHGISLNDKTFNSAWSELTAKQIKLYVPAQCTVCRWRMFCPICSAVAESMKCGKKDVPERMCAFTNAYIKGLMEQETDIESKFS